MVKEAGCWAGLPRGIWDRGTRGAIVAKGAGARKGRGHGAREELVQHLPKRHLFINGLVRYVYHYTTYLIHAN